MMVKRAKNIKFGEFGSRGKKNFGFQNLEGGKPFLNIEVSAKPGVSKTHVIWRWCAKAHVNSQLCWCLTKQRALAATLNNWYMSSGHK